MDTDKPKAQQATGNIQYTIPAFGKSPKLLRNLGHAHDVAEDVSGEGRKDTPCAEEKIGTVETE